MNQQTPRQANNLTHLMEEIDRASGATDYGKPVVRETPPVYGGPQRDAISSVVDGIVGDICSKIADLRTTLDTIEQTVLQSAAKSKHALNEHIATCVRINDEVVHMRGVITDLAEQVREP